MAYAVSDNLFSFLRNLNAFNIQLTQSREVIRKENKDLLRLLQKEVKCMQKRKLEELNLLDDFLFNKMVSHPEFGEEFSRELLRIILGKEVGKLQVVPQKIYYGSDTETHGARLDVYLEEVGEDVLENATVYDVEPESEGKDEKIETLARRTRFYHSKIDVGKLKAGQDYTELKNVIIIFIMPKDPFGENRMIYTIANRCLEVPTLLYDDGSRTLFLNTKGIEGNPKAELKELLKYMEQSSEENVKNETLKRIHHMTKCVKSDKEVSIEYMKIYEREQMIKERGFEEGKIEQAMESARRFFENGADFALVRASIPLLSEELLQTIYEEVKK